MLIATDNKETQYLAAMVYIQNDKTGQKITNVASFDTETKESLLFVINDHGEVVVEGQKPVTEPQILVDCNAYHKETHKLINDKTTKLIPQLGRVPK